MVRDVGITETLSLGPPMRPLALGELVEAKGENGERMGRIGRGEKEEEKGKRKRGEKGEKEEEKRRKRRKGGRNGCFTLDSPFPGLGIKELTKDRQKEA